MRLRLLAFAFTSLLTLAPAGATVVQPLDLDGLVDHADRVLLGRVESQAARWTAGHDGIYTEVTIRVEQALKGALRPGDRVLVRREGGEVGGIGMRVAGAAHFTIGEEVLLFVERRGASSWTVGMAQGKMRVAAAPDGSGRRIAVRDVSGLAFLDRPSAEPIARALDEVLDRIVARAHGAVKP